MGLFDFLKPKAPLALSPSEPKQVAAPYLGDLAKTGALYELISVPEADRGEDWSAAFLANLPAASFRCGNPQIIQGPDGFPYFQLFLPEPGVEFQCYVIDRMKDDFLLERGLGVAINPTNTGPAWVLSYGDVLNFHLHNEFYSTGETPFSKQLSDEVTESEEEVMIGQPSELLLPQLTRNILRDYLTSNGVDSPKVLLMMRRLNSGPGISQDLVFNITPQNFDSEETYRSVMQLLAWFLPRHYSFVGMREQSFENGFMPL